MKAKLPGAKESPRIDKNNVIKWYYGDTFEIHWHLTLKQNGELIKYKPDDQMVFSFYTAGTDKFVHRFVCKNIDTTTNMVILVFDKETTVKFKPGRYHFSVKYISDSSDSEEFVNKNVLDITTVGAKYMVEVEKCQ